MSRGIDMKLTMTQAEIVRGFELVGVKPIERDIRSLRELMNPNLADQESARPVLYRTVLTNGTGKLQGTEHLDAELERNAS